ncbi:hypothetical protein DPMN_182061 [Dreissena polymorpha]|uniref:Neurotransmitter-gated ion-channel transmembrane domain-containing protein n=1 Tax=Dreissena polymorpha TaxID=45954 RepID=A0A9D4DEQ8_DREPO|nr:hypothetical protein DPMN_182061 [Dreissena polymorpha]
MTLKRKSTFYVFYILIPIVLLSFLNVLTFALPVSSGERASYAVTVFLSLAVFLTIVASEIPKNANTIISVYITAMIALSTATVMTSLLESRLAFRDKYAHSIGSGYMTLYRLARICQCKDDGDSRKGDGDSRLAIELGWEDVVAALDYFFFFVLTFLATAVLFFYCDQRVKCVMQFKSNNHGKRH